MRWMKKIGLLAMAGATGLVGVACGGAGGAGDELEPMVLELSESQVVVGETVYFVGKNFRKGGRDGYTRITFEGEFMGDNGDHRAVNFSFVPMYDGRLMREGEEFSVLRWSRFGPFAVPFGGVQTTGKFRGQIIATNVFPDGTEVRSKDGGDFEMVVGPSVVIEELEPMIAECGAPVLRGLGGMPYRMRVRAVGFAPRTFRYTINNINGYEGPTVFEHTAYGPTDVLGMEEPFVLNPVPDDRMAYVTNIRVEALDEGGRGVETALPLSVHRPLEFFYEGGVRVAEYYPPVPVSGCMPGSIANRVCYSESDSEMRQQSVSITVSHNWANTHGTTNTAEWMEGFSEGVVNTTSDTASLSETSAASETYGVEYGHSEANSVGFSTSDGENWEWNMSEGTTNSEYKDRMGELMAEASLSGTVTVSGEGGVPGFGKVGGSASTTAGVKAGATSGWTTGERTDVRQDQGWSAGGYHDETNSYGSTTTDSMGSSFSGTYTVGSTSTASHTDTEARSQTRTYNIGGSVSESNLVTEGMSEAEERTWVESSTHTTLMSYCGFIPMDRYGVFYRQTVRMVKRAQLRSYDLCGRSEVQSELTFNEWTWAPDLAIGDECAPEPPPSNLPEAQCMIPPCTY